MHFSNFKKFLLKIRDFDLPGNNSLLKLAPPARIKQILDGFIPKNPKLAAVLVLFYGDNNNNTRMTLILRNTYNGIHSNQVSFPGGKKDDSDFDLKQTAIRETVEELGLDKSFIEIIKPLSKFYIPPSNFNVQPFLGIYNKQPKFNPCINEVSLVISPLFDDLMNMKVVQSEICVNNKLMPVPSYIIDKQIVWGATAMIINECISLFNDVVNS